MNKCKLNFFYRNLQFIGAIKLTELLLTFRYNFLDLLIQNL